MSVGGKTPLPPTLHNCLVLHPLTMRVLSLMSVMMFVSAIDNKNIQEEFMQAMDEVKYKSNLKILENRLLAHAVPRFLEDSNSTEEESATTLDLSGFAMKYIGCQNIKSFSDDLAESQSSGSVLGYNRFVVFRLCPAGKCSTYNKYGCQDSFGEYIIEMEMYLEIMSQYHRQKYLDYCATCIECMNPPNDDTLYTVFNSTTNETIYTWTQSGNCEYYNACRNYNQACKNYNPDTDDSAHAEILGCTAFALGSDVVYLGPHCASDGKSITMGLYKDSSCTEYVGNEASSGYSTGVDDTLLQFFYNPTCISCMNTDTYALFSDDSVKDDVYEMCEVLYDAGGKCNRYMNSKNDGSTFSSFTQESNEATVCSFIESIMENTYDETGEIIIESESFHATEWKSYKKAVSKISPFQLVGVVASFLLVLSLLIYAIVLYGKVRRVKKATKLYPTYRADEVSRSQSGICMNRTNTDSSRFV